MVIRFVPIIVTILYLMAGGYFLGLLDQIVGIKFEIVALADYYKYIYITYGMLLFGLIRAMFFYSRTMLVDKWHYIRDACQTAYKEANERVQQDPKNNDYIMNEKTTGKELHLLNNLVKDLKRLN